MNLRIGTAVAAAMCAATLSACGSDPSTTGIVSHSGPFGISGSTRFMLQGSNKTYDCYVRESDDCTLIKEGLKVWITYSTYADDSNSVTSLRIVDSPRAKPTATVNPNPSAPQ